ncbi:MAG: tetratricopeptide repeat protein [Methylomonas sp.]|jgi:predicted O-linked N-acetylglucosamine transferase (SPINDLY family)
MKPKKPSEKQIALFHQAIALHQSGQLLESLAIYKKLLQVFSKDPELLERIGAIELQQGHLENSLLFFERSLQIAPKRALTHGNRGIALHQLDRPEQALASYDQAINLKPDYVEAYINRGIVFDQMERYEKALADFDQAINLNPDRAIPYNYRGAVFLKTNRLTEALENYEIALALNPNYSEAYLNRGDALEHLNRLDEAMQSYDRAIALNPVYTFAYFKRGNVLHELKKLDLALDSFNRALALDPDFVDAYVNKGIVCQDMKSYEDALSCFDNAIARQPDSAPAYTNKATVLQKLKRYEESLPNFERAVALNPGYVFLFGEYLFNKLQVCDWSNLDFLLAELLAKIQAEEKISAPFQMLAFFDDAAMQQKAAAIWIADKYHNTQPLSGISKYPEHKKIRIGYFSADFCNHPVSDLSAQLYEKHDRNKFEITAFSYTEDTNNEMRTRLEAGFDRFVDIREHSDQEAVQLARDLEIDIAVDLGGHTGAGRTGIFAMRAAPVQVNYLGYAGTIGASYMDYIIADRIVIPETSQAQYHEIIAYLPNSFQVNDNTRRISDKLFTREDFDLPATDFVFCCFNNSYKINPGNFQIWMRILAAVEGSVLWLPGDSAAIIGRLQKAAAESGIEPERLIFAPFMARQDEHLARLKLADLFLDTMPYNAHATASDALWSGLPLLTCLGDTYAGRVSASVLTAMGLPELITASREQYAEQAIELARNPEKLADIKGKLAQNRLKTPLFDTQLYTTHIEAAYTQMYQRYLAGLQPDVISVQA